MAERAIDVESLSIEERLDLLERLWDSLARTPDKIPLSDPQRRELDRRLDDLERDGPVGIPWHDVLERIKGRSK